MDKKEATVRYALQHGKLDDLKVWLLNGGSVNEYFTSHKQNIKLVIKEKSFSVTAKEAADIVEGMMPIEFSRQDFVNLYFKLSEEKQEELYDEVFSYYPQVIRTKKNPSSKEILDAVKVHATVSLNEEAVKQAIAQEMMYVIITTDTERN